MPHNALFLPVLDQEVMPLGEGRLAGGFQGALESVSDDAPAIVA